MASKSPFDKLLIPVRKGTFSGGYYRWRGEPVFASPRSADLVPLEQLRKDLAARGAVKARIVRNAFGPAALRIIREKSVSHPESYRLTIDAEGVRIYAGDDAGAYYGVQTLRELAAVHGARLPMCRIEDQPDFRRRGVCYDCSRGKVPTMETLMALVERLAHWKINELQLYVEHVFTWKQHPEIGRGYSPFTPEDILRLRDFCRLHHVRLVGVLASFGHLERILELPKYQPLGELPGFRGLPGGMTLCPGDPGSIRLIADLYREYIPLFEAADFNVCCDETWELGKGRSKQRADRLGVGRVYLEFLLKIYRLCERYDKRMNAWADIVLKHPELLRKLPRDIVLLNWEYEQDGANIRKTRQIAQTGMAHMVCPGTSSWLTHGSRMPNSMKNVANFSAQGRRHRAEGLLNTDWGDQGHRNVLGVSLHSFAHGAAHGWNGKQVDEEKFTEYFCYHLFGQTTHHFARSLRRLGSTYAMCGKIFPNRSLLYPALTEMLVTGPKPTPSAIDEMQAPCLRRILEEISEEQYSIRLDRSADAFEKLTLREYALAARMDRLACQRALAGQTLREGRSVPSRELRRLAAQMRELSEDFQTLWLLRNRPSRLCENRNWFRKIERESLRLAGKTAGS